MEPQSDSSEPTASRPEKRRFQTGLWTLIVLIAACGAVSWAVRSLRDNKHPEFSSVRALQAPTASRRVQALRQLGRFDIADSAAVISPLIVALGDAEADVRAAAAEALMYVGSVTLTAGSANEDVRAAVTALIGSLKDPQPSVRFAAAHSLGYITSQKGAAGVIDSGLVSAALARALGDEDIVVRLTAIKGLAACRWNVHIDPPKELIAALSDESAAIRAAAVRALFSFPCSLDPWLPSLFRLLEHDEPEVRAACAAALDRLVPPAVSTASLPALVEALGSEDWEVRLHAARALERLTPDRRAAMAIPALLAILKGTFVVDQVRAGTPSTRVTDDPRWDETAQLATRLLGQIAPDTESAGEVIAVLSDVVRSGHSFLPEFAAQALGDFGPAAQPGILDLIKFAREKNKVHGSAGARAARALGRIAPGTPSADEVVTVLMEALQSDDLSTRRSAIEALRQFGPEAARAIPTIQASLKDADTSIRSAAAQALASLGASE